MDEIITNSYEETLRVAGNFANSLKGGEIVGLSGELGSGKTAFVKGVMLGLGYNGYVKSPTFTLVNQYQTAEFNIFHFDIYRLNTFEELLLIGFESYSCGDSITLIEWFDKFEELVSLTNIRIYFEHIAENSRLIKILR